MELGEQPVRGREGPGVRIADAGNDIPVVAGAAEAQRRARRDDMQPAVGVELVGEREQVALVRAATVMEGEQALRVAASGPLAIAECHERAE